jgi:arylsulfatase A-like enzyme
LSLWAQWRWSVSVELGDLLAYGWDVPLTAGVFTLGRLICALFDRIARVRVGWRYLVLVPLGTVPLFTRVSDLVYCALTGGRFTSDGFVYLSLDNAKLLGDGDNPVFAAVFFTAAAAMSVALARDGRRVRVSTRWIRVVILVCAALGALALPLLAGFRASEENRLRWVPEARFLREWLVWQGTITSNDRSALNLPAPLKQRFIQSGLLPEHPLWKDYPLSRASLDTTSFPYPKTQNAALGPANVVLIMVEQLDREFIYTLSDELRGAMPELSRLAKRATLITEYQSVTQPTIHALVASLCSMLSAAPYRDLNEERGSESLERTPLTCLPQILKVRGYRTAYIQAGNNRFAGTEGFLRVHGFSETYDQDDIKERFPGADESSWGAHDDALSEYSRIKLDQFYTARDRDGRPFFLMVQTMDMHLPGHAPADCPLPEALRRYAPDDESESMLRAVHCTDQALGRLLRAIVDNPSRANTTIVALTGDHPTSPIKLVKNLPYRTGHPYAGWSGPLPLLLFDPTHELPARVPVLSGHTDLAPTLLHMLGITDVPNAMTGYSIFGKRPHYPLLVGRMAPRNVAIYRPGNTVSVKARRILTLCRKKKPLIADDPQALSACDLWSWLRWQDALWKYKLIYPEKPQAVKRRNPSNESLFDR